MELGAAIKRNQMMNNQGNKYTTKILGMKGSHTCPTEKTIQT
jgi:hypothetical protein